MNSRKTHLNQQVEHKSTDRKKRATNILITITAVIILLTALCAALAAVLEDISKPAEKKEPTFSFYDADYEYDIFTDENYLALDRQIKYENPSTGITVAVTRENLYEVPTDQHKSVNLLIDFVEYAVNGKYEEFNAMFSDEYIDADGKLKMDFTMQQLYNIKITYVTSSDETVNGEIIESHDYWIEYMIRRNNGTFRYDMGSDSARKEYIRITERNGKAEIDVLAPYKTAAKEPTKIGAGQITALIVISAALTVTIAGGAYIIAKATRKR